MFQQCFDFFLDILFYLCVKSNKIIILKILSKTSIIPCFFLLTLNMLSRLINCQLIPGLSDYDCTIWFREINPSWLAGQYNVPARKDGLIYLARGEEEEKALDELLSLAEENRYRS